MVAAIEKNVVAAAADQPNDHGDVDFFTLGSAHDEASDFILGGGVANGFYRVIRRGRRRSPKKRGQQYRHQSFLHGTSPRHFSRFASSPRAKSPDSVRSWLPHHNPAGLLSYTLAAGEWDEASSARSGSTYRCAMGRSVIRRGLISCRASSQSDG